MHNYSDSIIEALIKYQTHLGIELFAASDIQVSEIGHGENNNMFKVVVGKKQFVFRIPFRQELVPKLKQEFQALRSIPNGIGPEALLLHEGNPTYMIQSLVSGIHITNWTPELIKAHVETMVRLHSSRNKTCNGIDIVSLFETKVDFRRKHDPEVVQDKFISKLTRNLLQQVKNTQTAFSNINTLSFIHGDLHPGNILVDGKAVHYVDWEEARYDDFALDVAGLLQSPAINTEQYLSTYQKAAQDEQNLAERVITWSLYKDFSFILHKKWESLNPASRTIHQSGQDYPTIITEMADKIYERMSLL